MTPSASRRALLMLAAASALPVRADPAAVIAAAKASVVPVGSYSATESPRFTFRGTGFVVGEGTTVVTNFHVLPTGAEAPSGPALVILVAQPGSRETSQLRRAQVVATDRAHDLALLQIEGAPLAPLPLDPGGAAREGQSVLLMGFPIGGALGFSVVAHRGMIASITTAALPAPTAQQLDPRALVRLREGNYEVLQLDATAYPGNSGGPLLDADSGRVVGIVNMVLVKAGRESALSNPTGITYAVPVEHLHALLKAPR